MPELTREQQTIEGVLKLVNREVWVVTAQAAYGILRGRARGSTATWVSQGFARSTAAGHGGRDRPEPFHGRID